MHTRKTPLQVFQRRPFVSYIESMGSLLAQLAQSFSSLERFGTNIARRQRLAAVLCGLLVLFVRAAELPRLPIPEPSIHDEFSFLLAADTFASGRLTNLTHPVWQHFESFHIIQFPTYMSMYPPGQGLVLAAGQILGNAWFGVLLSAALFCSVFCWMLQGWFPPGWAWLGGLLVAMRIGVFSGWMNTYSGTALAGIGGALLFGALPRILRRPQARHSMVMGLGVAILANTRPYEGLISTIPVASALLVWLFTRKPGIQIAMGKVALPLALVLLPSALATCYYNSRVTGDPFRMAYQVNRETYAVEPYFLWQSSRPAPVYRHEVLRKFYVQAEPGLQGAYLQDTPDGWLIAAYYKTLGVWRFYFGVALSIPLIAFPLILRDRRTRFWLFACLVFLIGLAPERYVQAHYLAPMAGAFYVIILQSMRHLRHARIRGRMTGLFLVRAASLLCVAAFSWQIIDPHPAAPYPGNLDRARALRRLDSLPGPQLAIVRYSSNHGLGDEWVYNRADIDHAKVVWAREMGSPDDQQLFRYFHDRTVWLVEPDQQPPRLTPYVPLQ